MSVVLDASALLAYLQLERGYEKVEGVLAQSVMSTVNWAEVIGKAVTADIETDGLLENLSMLGLEVVPFTSVQAEMAGGLKESTGSLGLSIGDRACLALGIERGDRIYTADRAWHRLSLGITIETIR